MGPKEPAEAPPDGEEIPQGGQKQVEKEKIPNEDKLMTGWEEIGFHRPLASYMWDWVIVMLTAMVGLFSSAYIMLYLYPYPEQKGYSGVAGIPFALFYRIFDVGTAFGIRRFIAEYRIKDHKKMLEYIRFFIWYQMWTGIIQVLIISILTLQVFRFGNMAYVTWLFLINCQKQWPGMLGTFKACIEGIQHYSKAKILGFIQGEIFQMATNVIFILWGRWWGNQDPAIGELMGATIGMVIGSYIDDFFAMMLSAYFFNKVMKPYGIKFREAWRFDFGRDVVKNCLNFGAQVSIVPIIDTTTTTMISFMLLDALPQYTTWSALIGYASGIAGIISGTTLGITESLAESYMNDKKELARFYITNSLKWDGFLKMTFFCIFIAVLPSVILYINEVSAMVNYRPALVFIPIVFIPKLYGIFLHILTGIFHGTNHVGWYSLIDFCEEVQQVFYYWLWLYVFKLPEIWGVWGIAFMLGLNHLFPYIFKMIVGWITVHKKILKVRIAWMQTFIVPLIAGLPLIPIGLSLCEYVFKPLIPLLGGLFGDHTLSVQIAAVITALSAILIVPNIYFPLTSVLGGWDDYQLSQFKKAVKLSGPSKFLFKWFYNLINRGVKLGRKIGLHNRFRIPHEDAMREIEELMEIKRKNLMKTFDKPVSKDAPWLKKVDLE
ncbi:MAG: hypothetical protein ACFFCS_18635 [Candidatus Hodarchaeota archaeon]